MARRKHYTPFAESGLWWFTTPYGRSAGFLMRQAAASAAKYSRNQDDVADAAHLLSRLIRGNPRNG